tara:strand:- start:5981 stop:6625 length:645 start_codon:yes stop_codon:yes gene_type:complete
MVSDVFQEVEEDIREEKYKKIWNRYKYYFISTILIIVMGVALNAFLKQQSIKEVSERSEKFFDAISLVNEDSEQAIFLLNDFSKTEEKSSEYNIILSLFMEASIKREKKDFSGALDIYKNVAVKKVDDFYIDYANLSASEVLISMKQIDEAINLLENLILKSSPLALIAKEYLGYIEISRGNLVKSKMIFNEIYEDASVSESMKIRVKEVLSIF